MLVDKIGADAFRELLDEELPGDWVDEREFGPELVERLPSTTTRSRARRSPRRVGFSERRPPGLRALRRGNVQRQRQEGFSAVEVKITRGDLTPEQFRGLGQIMRDFSGGNARSTVQQNLVLRWVRDESVYDVWTALSALGLGDPGAREITDVVPAPAPTAANSGSPPRWASTGPSKSGSTRCSSTTS